MRIHCQTFSLPKEGREFSDYEDACFPSSPKNIASHVEEHTQTEIFRTAVCDGATDSCFSKYWAQLLASSYGSGEWAEDISAQSLVAAQANWKEYVSHQDLPWYAEEKVKLGAFSAFVGLTLLDDEKWRAVAIGDCCLFHTRGAQLLDCFPLSKSADFSNFPFLLGSLKERNDGVFEQKQTKVDGRWASGDIFLLMSDALACWFLRCVEGGAAGQLIEWLTQLDNHDLFAQLIRSQRAQLDAQSNPNMKDDDVTLLKICVSDQNATLPVVQGRSATQPAPQLKQSATDAETMRLGTIPKSQAQINETVDRTVAFSMPAQSKPAASAGSTEDVINKLAEAGQEEPALNQPTLRHMPAKASAQIAIEAAESAAKAARRATSERAASRQTRGESDEHSAPTSEAGQKPGAAASRRSSQEFEEVNAQPTSETSANLFELSGNAGKASNATSGRRNVLVVACLLFIVFAVAAFAVIKNLQPSHQPVAKANVGKAGATVPAKTTESDGKSGENSRDSAQAPTATDAPVAPAALEAAVNTLPLAHEKHSRQGRKSRKIGNGSASSLRVPPEDLPRRNRGGNPPPVNFDSSIRYTKPDQD